MRHLLQESSGIDAVAVGTKDDGCLTGKVIAFKAAKYMGDSSPPALAYVVKHVDNCLELDFDGVSATNKNYKGFMTFWTVQTDQVSQEFFRNAVQSNAASRFSLWVTPCQDDNRLQFDFRFDSIRESKFNIDRSGASSKKAEILG